MCRSFYTNSLLGRLDHHAESVPHAIAYTLLKEHGEPEQLTFSQLACRVRAFAAHLAFHTKPSERAILLYPHGLEFIVAFLGCLAAGVIAVPAYPPRRNRNADRLKGIITDCQPSILLTTYSFKSNISKAFEGSTICFTDGWVDAPDKPWEKGQIQPDAIAFLQYTSGSTGTPKGVMITHRNIIANEYQIAASFGHDKEEAKTPLMVSWLPLYHDMGLIGGVLQPLYVGFRSVLLSPIAFFKQPARWLQAISDYGGTTAGAPNFAYDQCVKTISDEQKQGLDLSSLRVLYNGAEPVRADTIERFTRSFSSCGFEPTAFFPCYGLAEATLFVSGGPAGIGSRQLFVKGSELDQRRVVSAHPNEPNARCLVSSNELAPNVIVKIVDTSSRKEVEPGQVGEIWVQSPSVAAGYWNRPNETAAAFSNRLTHSEGETYLNTGDLGFLHGRELVVTGRSKDLIIIRGRNLYPQDIEAAVVSVLPFLGANCCAAFSLETNGQEQLAIVIEADRNMVRLARALAEQSSDAAAAEAELSATVAKVQQIVTATFEVTVQSVTFVRPGTFPRTSSGKVQRRSCRTGLNEHNLEIVFTWPRQRSLSIPSSQLYTEVLPSTMLSPEASRLKADDLITWLREYARRRLNSILIDERRCVPPYVVLDFGLQGLFGMQVSPAFAGIGLNTLDTMRVLQQLAAIDLTLCLMVGVHNGLGLRPIQNFASESLKTELLPLLASGRQLAAFALTEHVAGSNPNAIETTARREKGDWIVNGEKSWIGLASWAGVIITIAKATDAEGRPLGMIALVIREDTHGVRQGPESLTMGVRGIVQNQVYFENARVSDRHRLGDVGQGMQVAQDAMMFSRMGLAAISVGSMKRCVQLGTRYASRRTVASGRLLDHAVTRHRLSETILAAVATEALVECVAGWIDSGRVVPAEAYITCKTTGPEFLGRAADQLMQLLGGRGYEETSAVPQLVRDARLTRIFEGPTETLYSYLGSSILQHSTGTDLLIREWLSQTEIADELRDLIESIRHRANDIWARQWIGYQLGELASTAILASATLFRAPSSTLQVDAKRWAFDRFRHLCEQLHRRISQACPSAQWLHDTVLHFTADIDDVEQTLPAEEYTLDPMLRVEESVPQTAVQQARIKCVPSRSTQSLYDRPPLKRHDDVAGRIHASVLKWMQENIDTNCQSVDPDTPFPMLGMDSLGAAIVTMDIEQQLGARLTPDLVYELQTINQLARYLGGENRHRISSKSKALSASTDSPGHSNNEQSDTYSLGKSIPKPAANPIGHLVGYPKQNERVNQWKAAGQYFYETVLDGIEGTKVRVGDQQMVMFSSYSYLGLIGHPEVNDSVIQATQKFGSGCHGARLIAGTTSIHRELEKSLSEFLQTEDAVVFNSGYVTNLATIAALAGEGDVVISDEYNHASIVDGCKFSGAKFLSFRHSDLLDLERCLREADCRFKLVIVDAVYSMEGDISPLPEIVELCSRYNAMLMVDEAHSLGVLGRTGRGIQEHFNLPSDAIPVKMGTLSKSLGSCGGYIAGSRSLIDHIKHTARGFVFSVAAPVPIAAAALSSLRILQREPKRVAQLHSNTDRFVKELRELGFRLAPTESPIVPIICRNEDQTLTMTGLCRGLGLFLIPIFYPAVPMNAPRIRLSVTAEHSDTDIDFALGVLEKAGRDVGLIP